MSAERTQGCAVTYGRAVRYQSEICVADRHDTARCLNGPLSVLIERCGLWRGTAHHRQHGSADLL